MERSKNLKCVLRVLLALKYLGVCPFERTSTSGQYRFSRRLSFGTSWGFIMTLAAILFHVVYITHVTFHQYWLFGPGIHYTSTMLENHVRSVNHLSPPQKDANIFCGNATMALICVQYFLYLGASYLNRHVLPELLNQWDKLDQLKLSTLLSQDSLRQSSPKREEMAMLMWIFGLALFFSLFPTLLSVSVVANHPDVAAEVLLETFVTMFMGFSEVFHDSVMVLMCKELRGCFLEVANSLEQSLRCCNSDDSRKPRGEVIAEEHFCDLVLAIRNQGSLFSLYLTPGQLSYLFQTMVFCLLSTFIVFITSSGTANPWGQKENVIMQIGNLICAFCLLARLYYKFSVAQEVINAEAILVSKLTSHMIRQRSNNSQLKQLVDLMVQKPCKINLGDLVILRKRLFLSVFGQLATYLIVVTQFYHSK